MQNKSYDFNLYPSFFLDKQGLKLIIKTFKIKRH